MGIEKGTTKKLCDKDFAERLGELSGVIRLKTLVYWVMTGNPLELFRKFFGAVRAIFWFCGLVPEIKLCEAPFPQGPADLLSPIQASSLGTAPLLPFNLCELTDTIEFRWVPHKGKKRGIDEPQKGPNARHSRLDTVPEPPTPTTCPKSTCSTPPICTAGRPPFVTLFLACS